MCSIFEGGRPARETCSKNAPGELWVRFGACSDVCLQIGAAAFCGIVLSAVAANCGGQLLWSTLRLLNLRSKMIIVPPPCVPKFGQHRARFGRVRAIVFSIPGPMLFDFHQYRANVGRNVDHIWSTSAVVVGRCSLCVTRSSQLEVRGYHFVFRT